MREEAKYAEFITRKYKRNTDKKYFKNYQNNITDILFNSCGLVRAFRYLT